ncbi:MAG: exopolysaccharide biosynthesis polyprenyl glycosylphosphotransferase [Solirubrobacterales bacterium]
MSATNDTAAEINELSLTDRPAPVMRALEAQRLLDLISLKVMPAAAAGLITYLHLGAASYGLLMAATMLVALQLVERCALPLGLMPAARITLALVAPILGAMLALVLELGAGDHVALGSLEPSVIGAWLVLALGAWVTVHFQEGRPARVAVVGSEGFASDLAAELEAAGIRGYEVIGWFGAAAPAAHSSELECLGALDGVRAAVTARRIELLVWAREETGERHGGVDPDLDPCALIADACLDLPVRMIEASQLYEELLGHVPLGTIDSAWFRYIMHPRFRPTSPLSKRCSDLAIALPTTILALPLLGILAIAIKLSDNGPVLYRQRRIGERGKSFNVLKLRTMVTDAEAAGPQWCTADDDRVTRLGRVLRRTHLDELPQLWNVLRGEMTLVGPRPERPEIVTELERRFPHYTRRHLVKPGITGWAQLRCGYAGSELGTAWKLCHDLFYVKRRSVLADWLIIVETVFEAGRDAHRALRAPGQRFLVGEASD